MEQELESIKESALSELAGISDQSALEQARVKYLGKKSRLKEVSSGMRDLAPDQKKVVGKTLSMVTRAIEAAIEEASQRLQAAADAEALASIDITLPGYPMQPGALHPVTQIQERAIKALRQMGLRHGQWTGNRNGVPLLRRAEYAARASSAKRTGHILLRRRSVAANSHFKCANKDDGIDTAAGTRDRSRQCFSS